MVCSRLTGLLVGIVCLSGLTGCGSVDSINERALLARSDRADVEADPIRWMRPQPTEYHLGPRDLLEIEVFELEEPGKSKLIKTRVSQDGRIVLPLIGVVAAGGQTVAELQTRIEQMLGADYLVHPSVSVLVAEYQSRRVTVLGAVQKPGTFTLRENTTTLVDALALAGGPNEKAGSTVYVVRAAPVHEEIEMDVAGQELTPLVEPQAENASARRHPTPAAGSKELPPHIVKVDLIDLVERGNLSANCTLADGDVIHVPPASTIFVTGKVKVGGAFPLRGEVTILQAIAMAGGLTDEATPSETQLIRRSNGSQITIPVDLTQVEAGSDKDLQLQPDDVLVLNESNGSKVTRTLGQLVRGLFSIGYSLN